MYIVFEGIIGSGKTTQSKKLVEYLKYKFPTKEIVWTKEPGGTEIADVIRNAVLRTTFVEEMEPLCEAYLLAAARAQSLRAVVQPVLAKGNFVVSDRSFLTSLANQARGRDMGFETIMEINKYAVDGIFPDLIIFIDLDIETALQRTSDNFHDKFENLGRDFHTKVLEGYKQSAAHDMFRDIWITIDGSGTEDEVFARIKTQIAPWIKARESNAKVKTTRAVRSN